MTRSTPRRPDTPRPGDTYQVVVAGGGPAGAVAATVLARAGRRVLLADADLGPPKTVESLPPTARLLLTDLRLPTPTPGPGALPCHARHSAWGTPTLHTVDLLLDPHGHAWQLDRRRFDHALRQAAVAAGAELAAGHAVRRPTRHGRHWHLTLATGPSPHAARHPVRCAWLVDATGRRTALAVHHGARRTVRDTLLGLVLTLPTDPADQDTTSLVEAAPDGWWYTARHPAGPRLLAHFTDADPPGTVPRTGAQLRTLLATTRHVARRVPPERVPTGTPPRRTAAHTAHLDTVHGDGWVAAGDAALAMDPLSSQGVLTALYTGMCAGQAVDAHLRGDPHALTAYATTVRHTFDGYLREHHAVYAGETRWPHRPFWARRHRAAPAGAPPTAVTPRPAAGDRPPPPHGTDRRSE